MDIDDHDDSRTYYCHTCESEVSYAAYIEDEGAYQCVDCGDLFVEVRGGIEVEPPEPSRPQNHPGPQPQSQQQQQQQSNQNFTWTFSMNSGPQTVTFSSAGPNVMFGGSMFQGGPLGSFNNGPLFNEFFGPNPNQPNQPPEQPNQPSQPSRPNQPNQPNQPSGGPSQPQQQQHNGAFRNVDDLFQEIFAGMPGGDANNNPQNPFVQLFRMPIFNLNQANMQGMNFGNINMGDFAWGPMTQIIANLVDPNHHGPPPASKEVVEQLPDLAVTQEMIDSEQFITDCAVCKEEFQVNERCLKLPCDHLYHKQCILPWLQRHNTCPVCRFEMRTDNEFYEQLRAQRDAARNNGPNQRQPGTSSSDNNDYYRL